ncbi:hypothetical protein K9L67_02250 [Candidatus Woesearchaeota archaeon]|nr:hypothetical protein [Candidatus Woesearchaeota archaeon]MCF7901026.1 hypothetical protein [Candidatus Woesearchaeota archaeon]MCF8013393.1 hypothetical protein [Candidatus Woesearchaeota archaeon]
MNKKYLVLGLALIALLTVGLVSAYGGFGQMIGTQNGMMTGDHHEEVETILETGTYQDLVDYREETGFPVMNRVQSQEDFEVMQAHHKLMEENGYEPGQFRGTGEGPFAGQGKGPRNNQGMGFDNHKGQGMRGQGAGFGGCPMLN